MNIIQQIVMKTVVQIEEKIYENGLCDITTLAKALSEDANEMVLEVLKHVVELADEALVNGARAMRRKDGITVKEHGVERSVMTALGEFKYKRTYFANPDGTYMYLLDQLIGIEPYERFSRDIVAEILQASTTLSYEKAAGGKMSRQAVHDHLVDMADLVQPVSREEKTPEVLDIFADEDHVHLNPKGSAIVPIVTVTEGIDSSNPKRHRTIAPLHIAAYGMQIDAFRENVLAVLTEKYDLDKVRQINIHADGGIWIAGLQDLLPRSRIVLDGFHLERDLRSFLNMKGAKPYAAAIRRCMSRDDGCSDFLGYCYDIYTQQDNDDDKEKIVSFMSFCDGHWNSIVPRMKKETCGSCTEPLVSHVLSERLSRDPIAWSRKGLQKITMLVVYAKNGGVVRAEDVRRRTDSNAETQFREEGYAAYREYASKQAEAVLKEKHDWSIFEHEYRSFGKIDGPFMIRKAFGSLRSLTERVS